MAKVTPDQLAEAQSIIDTYDEQQSARLGVTREGRLTFDGEPVEWCPQPLSECRPGACNCDGIREHWRMWHTDPERRCPRADTDCPYPFSCEEA